MIEKIGFERKGKNQSVIKFYHETGEITSLLFNNDFPLQAEELYKRIIEQLLKNESDLSFDDDLYSIMTFFFVKNSLGVPIGFNVSKNEDRIRIGKRIKEIRKVKQIDAKSLSILTGIDAANLCRIEQGKQSVGIDVLSKIANAMGYRVDFVELGI